MTGRTGRILIVEDSPTQAVKLKLLLERHGYQAEVSPSAEAALERLGRSLPDLVIVDYHLPGMNGDGLAREVRINARTRALPLLMLTQARERDLERQGLESGIDAYVEKSAPEDLFLLRIKALLRRGPVLGEGEGENEGGGVFRRATLLIAGELAGGEEILASLGRDAYHILRAAGGEAAARARDGAVDCVLVDFRAGGDPLALAASLGPLREQDGEVQPAFIMVGLFGEDGLSAPELARAYAAGFDDMIPADAGSEMISLRMRALIRRKLLQDEKVHARAAEAKAAMAGELARANDELEQANRRLRETQSQLVHAAKMASLGELVAGIAHEINNPLAFILAHHATVERLLQAVRDGGGGEAGPRLAKAAERLASMRVGLLRIQDLVLNLRKFSRLDEGEFRMVDVPAGIETVLTLLSHKLTDEITIKRDFRAERELSCSPALLNQVVMNILGNAADAISAPGRPPGIITIGTRSTNEDYRIIIGDNGPGVPDDLQDRVFEPFFTTKAVGSGTGLGLAISYGVVLAHKGTIEVGRSPEGGAQFTIRVPRGSA